MKDFNIVPEIGGVDTSDPGRSFEPEEQKAVIEALFGATSPAGVLSFPGGEYLYIGTRKAGKTAYSIGGHGKGQQPALYVPKVNKNDRPLLTAVNGGGFDGNGHDESKGFIPTATGLLLSLGVHAMREASRGEAIKFGATSDSHKSSRDCLTGFVIGDALLVDPEDELGEDYPQDLQLAIDKLLGEELAQLERLMENEHCFNWKERPYEDFVVDLIRRIHLLRQA